VKRRHLAHWRHKTRRVRCRRHKSAQQRLGDSTIGGLPFEVPLKCAEVALYSVGSTHPPRSSPHDPTTSFALLKDALCALVVKTRARILCPTRQCGDKRSSRRKRRICSYDRQNDNVAPMRRVLTSSED